MKKILTPTNYELIPLNDKTNVRFYTSADSGSYVAPHWHDAIEIIYLQEGELKVTIENSRLDMKANQCVMIRPNLIHSTLCTKSNLAIVFQIPETFVEKFIPDAKMLNFSLKDPADTAILQSKVDFFKETMKKMQLLIDLKPDGALLRFNSLLFEILFQLYHNFSTPLENKKIIKQNKDFEKMKPILDYITNNYNRAISLDEIASVAMLQSKYFCRFFKNIMGVTFLRYQNEIRLSKIYEDIISTDDKISDILERHGFSNYKLFRRMFQEHFNATPMQVRKKTGMKKSL